MVSISGKYSLTIRISAAFILLACFAALLPAAADAGSKETVDVVLVMDSTGSMKKTDPLSLRIPAGKLFLSLLDKNDRAAVISFTDSATTLAPLTSLDTESNKGMLMSAVEKINSSGLQTNLYEGLNKGYETLSAGKKEQREQIIVFMSDGMMDTGSPEQDKTFLEKLKNDLAKTLTDKDIKVYAIAFTEGSDRQLLEKVSKQTGGFYNLALTDKDLHVVFTSIFESLKKPDMLPMNDNGFLIDKSVEEVTIVATKGAANTTIQLAAPDGSKHSFKSRASEINWFVSDNFDMITVQKPPQGRWEILFSTGKNNKAYIITNLNLMTNFSEMYPVFGETLDISVWLEREGKPLQEKSILDTIDMHYELSKPDGETVQLQPFPKEDGTYERKIELFTAGNYKLRLIAKGKTFEREKTFTFKVADAKESKEDLAARQEKKERAKQAQPPPEEPKEPSISWTKIIIQFVIINLVIGTGVLIYVKGKYLLDKMRSLKKRKSDDKD